MADVASLPRTSKDLHPASLDTTIPPTSNGFLAPQSPADSDSGSDYSQAHSRPVSLEPQPNQTTFHDVSLVEETDNQVGDEEEEEEEGELHDFADSGSDYSDAHPASRPTSIQPRILSAPRMSLLPEPHTPTAETRSQPPDSPTSTHAPVAEEKETPKALPSRPASLMKPLPPQPVDASPYTTMDAIPVSPPGSDYSGSAPTSPVSSKSASAFSPMTPQEARRSIDSMQSIALSESSLDYDHLAAEQVDAAMSTPKVSGATHLRKPSSLEILQNAADPPQRPGMTRQSTFFDFTKDQPLDTPGAEEVEDVFDMDNTSAWKSESTSSLVAPQRESGSSDEDTEVDWQALDKTEEQEKEDKDIPAGAEDESTAFLLARLEQENAKFTADPKTVAGVAMNKQMARVRSKSRPPSMAQLKRLVSKDAPSWRYSVATDTDQSLPEDPPPMTELEFWAALVQDYPSTASRLPTLTTTKIRAGIPPPLRGVVWASMSGARDKNLEEAFDNLQDEQSPYEGLINKDVGRSFPGVELFRDADGEGQKMLGRVLKCFSLQDKDIGYCQGLGFLVGPLLMNMGEKEAFCVLVRLMDHYGLRASFLPSLSGLHMRIFQFSTLLAQHHPQLFEHLASLGVEPAYLSQWFLSCFAVTCPLPMLFRIYDVIFAEGANETVMRVALALFRRNEEKMMASHEFEEVMQLLLGRGIWDVYGCSPDELVDDFTSLGNIITHQRLAELENEFETKDGEAVGHSAGFLPDVQAAASRFLGRLWAPSHAHTPSKNAGTSLSPESAEKETPSGGFLSGRFRRAASKSGIIFDKDNSSSEGSNSSGSASVASTAQTDAEIHDAAAADSQADSMSLKSKSESMQTVSASGHAQMPSIAGMNQQQELHSQIEDLLMALGEMQREHAQMAAMLQKEREERNDDHRVVRQLVGKLRRDVVVNGEMKSVRMSMPPPPRPRTAEAEDTKVADKRKTLPPRPRPQLKEVPGLLGDTGVTAAKPKSETETTNHEEIDGLVVEVQSRLDSNARFSASFETRAQLRSNLARTREQLAAAESQAKDLAERAEFSETSLNTFQGESESLRSEVEELRLRVNDDFKEKQKLELTIQNMEIQMRMEAKALEKKQRTGWLARAESSGEVPTLGKLETHSRSRSRNGSISSAPGSAGGLRDLKLGRRDSVGSVQSIRSMQSQRPSTDQWPQSPPPPPPAVNVSPSPDTEAPLEPAPTPATPPPVIVQSTMATPSASHTPSNSLAVPGSGSFKPRTSSLAAKEVFATPQHEPVPDEALLLELVNAKTSEAQARQEVDELKRSLQVQKRRMDEMLSQLQAEAMTAKVEAEAARIEADEAREEAKSARAEVFDASPMHSSMISLDVTPAPEDVESSKQATPVPSPPELSLNGSPVEKPEVKKAETAPASSGGVGWFWSRRTASTGKAGAE